MPYERTEVSAQEIERQKEICARVRSALGSGERFAMVDTYGCQQNESDSEVLRGYLRSMGYTMTDDEKALFNSDKYTSTMKVTYVNVVALYIPLASSTSPF